MLFDAHDLVSLRATARDRPSRISPGLQLRGIATVPDPRAQP